VTGQSAVPRLEQLIPEDLVEYVSRQFGDITDWTDETL
jgi:hypothetical protein